MVTYHAFLPAEFFHQHKRHICSWGYHQHFSNTGCRRSAGGCNTRYGGSLSDLATRLPSGPCDPPSTCTYRPQPPVTLEPSISPQAVQEVATTSKESLIQAGLEAVSTLCFPEELFSIQDRIIKEEILPHNTASHIPRSVIPLLARVLAVELRYVHSGSWGVIRLQMFTKAVLQSPSRAAKKRHYLIIAVLLDRLRRWQEDSGTLSLWEEVKACHSSNSLRLSHSRFRSQQ